MKTKADIEQKSTSVQSLKLTFNTKFTEQIHDEDSVEGRLNVIIDMNTRNPSDFFDYLVSQ